MPRAHRFDVANGLHHVTQRGLERRNIVVDDDDRSHWWRLFELVALRCHWRVFAVVLLDNHFHIYLRTPKPNLSEGMHDLDGGYASFFNQRRNREGPIYQGRFKSVLVEDDSHSWELSRYVHLNPYRARLTTDPFRYHWCSYRFYLNGFTAPEWLDWKRVLAEFAGTESAARVAYKRFVESGMKTPPQDPLLDSRQIGVLGSVEFVERCKEWLTPDASEFPSLETVIEVVCAEFSITPDLLAVRGRHDNAARDAAVLLARERLSEPLEVIAAAFGGVSRSSISEIVKRARLREQSDVAFRDRIARVRDRLK